MRNKDKDRSFIKMYSLMPERLARPVTPEAYEEAVAYLLGRDSLEGEPEHREALRPLDAAMAEALRHTSADWWVQLTKMSLRCGFASAEWWLNLLGQASEAGVPTLRKAG